MAPREVVIDACCTLNLLATRRAPEIVAALEILLLNTPYVAGEPMFLWSPPNDEGERSCEPVSTEELRAAGHLSTHALDTDVLVDAFVAAAARIKDSDASCIALAGVLGCPLFSDDRKQRRIAVELFPEIELTSTLDLLQEASRRLRWTDDELSQVATDLRWRGNLLPLSLSFNKRPKR